jgi:hypothetical protein
MRILDLPICFLADSIVKLEYDYMIRIVVLIVILSISCGGPSVKAPQSAIIYDSLTNTVVTEDETISCDRMVSNLVQSSNAIALGHFGKGLVKSRIADITSYKVTIKLYVITDISETPSEERLVENPVGWLEFYKQTGKLLDITNDHDNPVVLNYDKSIFKGHNLFKLCSVEVNAAKPATNSETRDVMQADDIKFNGKLKRFFTMADFETVFGKPDSIKHLKDEAPCITIFDTEASDDKYLYKSASRFETSGDSVAVDEFWFLNGNFITYKGIRIDEGTTMDDLQRLFPTAIKCRLGMDKEGKLWVIQMKDDKKGTSDGHIKIFFKNGRVYFMHWWSPC